MYKQKWNELTKDEIKLVNEWVCDGTSQDEINKLSDQDLKKWFEADPNAFEFKR